MRGDVPHDHDAIPSGPRLVGIRRSILALAFATGTILACWAIGLTAYLCFQDEIAAVLLRRQADMQYAYEAQIDGLKAQLERAATHALVDRQRLDGRLATLAARQAQIEERQQTLSAYADRTIGPAGSTRASVAAAAPSGNPPLIGADRPQIVAKPTPISEEPRAAAEPLRVRPSAGTSRSPDDKLSQLETSLDGMTSEQFRLAGDLHRTARSRLDLLDGAIAAIGLDPSRLEAPAPKGSSGIGGPLVPVSFNAAGSPFEIATGELDATILRFGRLREVARTLPLTRPVQGSLDASSPFGYRVDPFTRATALHTGIDLKAEYGTEVRATGPGRVTVADASGGYGNMVEIDHGNDIVTRYAHLSIIGVVEGQMVPAGAVIGHVGSTGRSTGAHLHYETRIGGEPVNPQRFLQAGTQLASAAR